MNTSFSCKYSSSVIEILDDLKCSLLISSNSSNRIILQSSTGGELVQKPRNFPSPMGIAIGKDQLAISTVGEITFLQKIKSDNFTKKSQNVNFDSIYTPQKTVHCGNLKIHEIAFGRDGLWVVNTEFSCLGLLSEKYSFEPKWYPPFISKPQPGDACHLNGLAMQNGYPTFVSALGTGNSPLSWRQTMDKGCLINVKTNEIILRELSVPHSPRIIEDQLYVLQSGKGEVLRVDINEASYDVVAKLPGFVRGFDHKNEYLFVGYSKIRNSSGFEKLAIAEKATFCGIAILHKNTGVVLGTIQFENSVEEIFDVKIISHSDTLEILSPFTKNHRNLIYTSDNVYFL